MNKPDPSDDTLRREKANMNEPQEEFIQDQSVPSHSEETQEEKDSEESASATETAQTKS